MSLVDRGTKRVLNTVPIHPYEEDSFDVPYRIVPDYYYRVPGAKPGEEGQPKLLDPRDFNGDGRALEAAFFEAQACMGLLTTLVGYSPKQDRVVQYPVELRVSGDGPPRTATKTWVDSLFSDKPAAPGHWVYEIDYRGRGGSLEAYDLRYDPARERFRGTLRVTDIGSSQTIPR